MAEWRAVLHAWWQGVTAPLLWPVVTASTLVALAGVGLAHYARAPTDLAELPFDRALRHPRDDYRYVAHRVLALERDPPSGPAIYLLGGSTVRECIHSPDGLAAELRRASGRTHHVELLASSNQTFGQALAIVDRLPPTGGWVLIATAPGRFTRDPGLDDDQARHLDPLLLASPALARALEVEIESDGAVARRGEVGNLLRSWLAALEGDAEGPVYLRHRYSQDEILTDAVKRSKVTQWVEQRQPLLAERLDYHLDMLEAVIALARERGFQVALLEQPLNRAVVGDAFARAEARIAGRLDHLRARLDVPLVGVRPDRALTSELFYDLTHLVEPGRERWQRALARALLEAGIGAPP